MELLKETLWTSPTYKKSFRSLPSSKSARLAKRL
jgi:hypothetical protein